MGHLTDVESIMTLDNESSEIPKPKNDEMKDSGTESAASPTLNEKVKPPSQKSMFESNRFSTAAPMTPQHVAASLRLMAIWHAYYVVETTNLNVDIKSLRSMARLVSKILIRKKSRIG